MFVVMRPGDTGFDAAFPPSEDVIVAAVRDGTFDFMSCYVGGTHDQRTLGVRLAARGVPVSWNYERSETAWTQGYDGGVAQATDALRQLAAIGWEQDTPCIFSPYDSTVTNYQTGFAFARGVFDVFGAVVAGFYGDQIFLGSLSVQSFVPKGTVFWQWMNNGPTLPYATIRQTGHGTLAGHDIDNDLVKQNVRMWTGPGKEPDDMAQNVDPCSYVTVDQFTVYAVNPNGEKYHVSGAVFAARGRVIADAHVVTQAELDEIPDYVPAHGGGGNANGSFTVTGTISGGGTVS